VGAESAARAWRGGELASQMRIHAVAKGHAVAKRDDARVEELGRCCTGTLHSGHAGQRRGRVHADAMQVLLSHGLTLGVSSVTLLVHAGRRSLDRDGAKVVVAIRADDWPSPCIDGEDGGTEGLWRAHGLLRRRRWGHGGVVAESRRWRWRCSLVMPDG